MVNDLLEKARPKLRKWKVLNLYAGIGGNRKLWKNVDVTAVEINPKIAKIYQYFFPDDEVIVTDAHEYLLKHFKEFDFIWSSPPCQTHSKARYWASKGDKYKIKYPDMKLYQEIIFLDNFFEKKWCVENVDGYYFPLIKPIKISGHFIWSNFLINKMNLNRPEIIKVKGTDVNYGFDLNGKKLDVRKDQVVRNIVNPKLGKHILDCARKNIQQKLVIKDG